MTATQHDPNRIARIVIDAGVEQIRLRFHDSAGAVLDAFSLPSNSDLSRDLVEHPVLSAVKAQPPATYITGKLADVTRKALGYGEIILPAAALWSGIRGLLLRPENRDLDALAAIDLSASGYMVIGVDKAGRLKDDLLVVNPRCGAGSGANIDRVLQKLDIPRDGVDAVLKEYLGEQGRAARAGVNVRADRCGVFSSSATISDKNQGIPLPFALAVTLKSEVMKTCKKLPAGFDKVYLTGGVFAWQYTRDCALDYLREIGVQEVADDSGRTLFLDGVELLVSGIGGGRFPQPERRLVKERRLVEYPGFTTIKQNLEADHRYLRQADEPLREWSAAELEALPVLVGLDVGSTMAKLVIADAQNRDNLVLRSYSNHGDTIETIKHIFRDLQAQGVRRLNIAGVGITGSARYQVQEALRQIFPQLKERVSVLVENYAHARGSIERAREHIERLKGLGIREINEEFFVLVDIGGEDTKLSTISLRRGELFDNAMNVKCSAGTGSLIDSLRALFGIDDIADASDRAYAAERAFSINATCAVFLMENARKLQAQGHPQAQILASANWAIVENMARSLWSQVELPANAVVLLHGQTMLSEPLPLAVTQRLQEFAGGDSYALVPPNPGHRACLGLIKTLAEEQSVPRIDTVAEVCVLEEFIQRNFEKRIIQCKGVACGDDEARCNRTKLTSADPGGKRFSFSLGGCSAINELIGRAKSGQQKIKPPLDAYKELWSWIDTQLPRSEDPDRLVIPRSFAVSEWAGFLAGIFTDLGLPVHVDNVREQDLIDAQPLFHIDTCAPQIGAVGQYRRLAGEPHGLILVPQLEFLPTQGTSLGRTCTINQGGPVVARNLGQVAHPQARFFQFNLSLSELDPEHLACQLYPHLGPLFEHYRIAPSSGRFRQAVESALCERDRQRAEAQERAAELAETALEEGRQVAVVVGREYVLNPGIYDSHVGRLLRDKRITALPAYVLDLELDPDFKHLYWRNPHVIVTVLRAVAEKRLHQRLTHPRLKELFRRIETGAAEELLPVVQVSTFRCGPDSVTNALVAEIMKKRPFLLIQSDAAIKELAHLENRVNTYVKQLQLDLHGELSGAEQEPFEIRILDRFTHKGDLNRETDAIYFPTLGDNRPVTSVLRAAGYTCIDNYDDDSYDLMELVDEGRGVAGDAVCAPLAAVYGDVMRAMEDFARRKRNGDPRVAGKHRVLVFNNKGTGPCRQGQYSEAHKLFSHQTFGGYKVVTEQAPPVPKANDDPVLQFLIGEESKGYNFGVPEWVAIRAIQGIILQGVLHGLLFEGGAGCRDYREYRQFQAEFRRLKQEIHTILERKIAPGERAEGLVQRYGEAPLVGSAVKYFGYRLHHRDLQRALESFSRKWILPRRERRVEPIRIFIEGEAYMRTAQAEEIFRVLLTTLGFRRFRLDYSPLWIYLAYLLEEEHLTRSEAARLAQDRLRYDGVGRRELLQKEVRENSRAVKRVEHIRFLFTKVLARPLYQAAGLPMPEPMPEVLAEAREMMPTLRPYGELGPYVGEALHQLRDGVDLFLNVAPEGCMVSSMGEVLTPSIMKAAAGTRGKIQNIFSADGEVDDELLSLALLKALGPESYYRSAEGGRSG